MAAPIETYVYLAHISALREYYMSFKDRCTQGEKHTLNRLDNSLRLVESVFKRQGLIDNPDFDRLVEQIVEDMYAINVVEN